MLQIIWCYMVSSLQSWAWLKMELADNMTADTSPAEQEEEPINSESDKQPISSQDLISPENQSDKHTLQHKDQTPLTNGDSSGHTISGKRIESSFQIFPKLCQTSSSVLSNGMPLVPCWQQTVMCLFISVRLPIVMLTYIWIFSCCNSSRVVTPLLYSSSINNPIDWTNQPPQI